MGWNNADVDAPDAIWNQFFSSSVPPFEAMDWSSGCKWTVAQWKFKLVVKDSEGQISDIYDYHSVLVLGLVSASLGPGPRARFFPRRSISSCVARGSNTWSWELRRNHKLDREMAEMAIFSGNEIPNEIIINNQQSPNHDKSRTSQGFQHLVWSDEPRWSDERTSGPIIQTGRKKLGEFIPTLRHIWMINKQNCWCFSPKKTKSLQPIIPFVQYGGYFTSVLLRADTQIRCHD